MNVGTLRHRVEVQVASETQNAEGESVTSYTTTAKRWASIEPISGREYFLNQSVNGDTTHRVHIRAYEGLTRKDRLKWGSRYLNIEAIQDPEERGAEQVLMCQEVI